MKDEIKEILEELRKTADNTVFVVCSSQEELDKIPKYTANFLSVNDRQAKILLDYITNLLTDNKRLQHNEKVFKGRNEKAIEYLGINEEILETCEIYDVNGIEVYKILQGSDKNV